MPLSRPIAGVSGRHALLSPAKWLTGYTLAVALIPPVFAYATDGLQAIFGYLAADSFVYLSVAANSDFGFYTFDGSHATNGFHPLWQMLLQAIFQVFGIAAAKVQQIEIGFWLSVAMVTAGGVLAAQAVLRWTGSLAAAMLLFPGLFGMAMLLCGWPVDTMWHFMNGMESPASLLFFGLALFCLSHLDDLPLVGAAGVRRGPLLLLSLLSVGIVFSRLDDIFLPAIVAIWLLLHRDAPIARRVEALLWFGLPLGVALLAYLAFNQATVGSAMPISGAAKFDFRTPLLNIGLLGSSLHAMVPDFLYDPFSANPGDFPIAAVNWRNAQMLVPVIAARILFAHMHWLRLDRDSAFPTWMRLLLVYVMAKGLYNFLFVPLIHQGQWYYPLSVTIINIAAAILVLRLWRRWSARRPAVGRLLMPAVGTATVIVLAVFVHARQATPVERDYFAFFQRGPAIAERLRATVPDPRLIEADDGIVNYALGLPTMSGFLFAIDPDGYAAHDSGRFLSEAARRGYQLIGSLYYFRNATPDDLTPDRLADTLSKKLFNASEWDLDRFDFAVEYRDEETGAVFIRFSPKR